MSSLNTSQHNRFIRLRLILDIDEFSWLKMSEFALRGVEQLLTSMHVEFAIDMRV